MRLLVLELNNFRNLSTVRVSLGQGINYFWGENGAGKTALLEAVTVLARGRSFRSSQPSELVASGHDAFTLRASLLDEHRGPQTIAVTRSRNGRSRVKLNGDYGRKLSDVARILPIQVLLPSLSDLVFGPPVERRQWLDWGLFHVKPDYLPTLREFLKVLKQRNAALRAFSHGDLPQSGIDVWSTKLVASAEKLDDLRRSYLDDVCVEALEALRNLSPSLKIRLKYRRGWPDAESLEKVLSDSQSRDVKSGVTSAGPHRSDIELLVDSVTGGRAAAVLSRGQGKLVASAMVLGQARLLMRVSNRHSVFLIDDLGAEMDQSHSEALFRMLQEMDSQVLATSTQEPEKIIMQSRIPVTLFHVEHGTVYARESDPLATSPDAT